MPKTVLPGREDVIQLVGDLDDAVIAEILATGASHADIEEAVKWAMDDAEQLGKGGRRLSPMAKAVYDILVTEPSFLAPMRER